MKNLSLFLYLATFCFHSYIANAQNSDAPAWLEHLVPAEITHEDYLESQLVLDPNSIAVLRITMDPDDYWKLINNTSSDTYLQADMTFENPNMPMQTITQVGIRLRGAAARGSAKKSFKISFREFGYDEREFYSLRKLNLNCDFQDPHLMRAKVCTDLFRSMGVPAARVAYSQLYINGEYRGLFANYEDIDKALLESRFPDNDGNLYKCDGAPMTYGSGGYTLTTNEELNDHSDILEFIDVLNRTPQENFKREIEKVFNVDEMLMYVACNVLLGAWDDYWVLVKNYYLYHDLYSSLFNYIPHDFDGSLGTYWYPKDMDVARDNVYDWSPNSNRPMVEKLLEIPEYRDRYTHFLMLLCMHPFTLEAMEPEIDRTANMIRDTLTSDPYWQWDPADFDLAFEQAIPGSNVLYGLKEYIRLRQSSALAQLEKIGPYIKPLGRFPILPDENDSLTFSFLVVDIDSVSQVKLVYEGGSSSGEILFYDNGTGSDSAASDFVYTAILPPQSQGEVRYYVESTNNAGLVSRYPAQDEWDLYTVNYEPPGIVINEIMASNDTTSLDEYGEYDDWFELYNTGEEPVDLMGMYVSDKLSEPKKWRLGNLSIKGNDFLLLWADADPEQGEDHVGFKLSGGGEELGLFDTDDHQNMPLDSVKFGSQLADISLGRTEDGADAWVYFDAPTPAWFNGVDMPNYDNLVDITDLGGAVSEMNNDSPPDETIENIIDNKLETKYLTFSETTSLEYGLDRRSLVQGYAIFSANDAPDRDPSNWELQAYDAKTDNWITLHKVENEPRWLQRFQSKEFYFTNSSWYNNYRLNVASAHGVNIVQMAEFELFGEVEIISSTSQPIDLEGPVVSIYPNPVKDHVHIVSTYSMKRLSLYDVSGKMLKDLELKGEFEGALNLSELPSGLYILNIEMISGEVNRSRIIKN